MTDDAHTVRRFDDMLITNAKTVPRCHLITLYCAKTAKKCINHISVVNIMMLRLSGDFEKFDFRKTN